MIPASSQYFSFRMLPEILKEVISVSVSEGVQKNMSIFQYVQLENLRWNKFKRKHDGMEVGEKGVFPQRKEPAKKNKILSFRKSLNELFLSWVSFIKYGTEILY